jgi:hypothetical protein
VCLALGTRPNFNSALTTRSVANKEPECSAGG